MPGWQPPWDDVAFDHAAAGSAAVSCVREAQVVLDAASQLLRDRAAVEAVWTGGHALRHGAHVAEEVARLRRLRSELLALARGIRSGAAAAAAEQHRRERLRDRWHEERRAEEAAHAATAAAAALDTR